MNCDVCGRTVARRNGRLSHLTDDGMGIFVADHEPVREKRRSGRVRRRTVNSRRTSRKKT